MNRTLANTNYVLLLNLKHRHWCLLTFSVPLLYFHSLTGFWELNNSINKLTT